MKRKLTGRIFDHLRVYVYFYFLFFNFYFYFILLYNTVLVLPYIDMNPPRVYMHSQIWTPSYLPPHNISLGHPHAPAPSMLYPALDIDWRFDPYMIVYMFKCHSPKFSVLLFIRPVMQWGTCRVEAPGTEWGARHSSFSYATSGILRKETASRQL